MPTESSQVDEAAELTARDVRIVQLDETGFAVVDHAGRTSVPGVWGAGNAVDPRAQVITAAGAGSAAAIDINNDLVHEDVAIDSGR